MMRSHFFRPGFALIAALWILVALSIVALEMNIRAREARRLAINSVDWSRARWAAEAGIQHAQARLEAALERTRRLQTSRDPWHHAHRFFPSVITMGRPRYRITLEDASAHIDLNRATGTVLRRFFRALRVDYGRADRITQSILDWRDRDDLRRGRGAEREAYLRMGRMLLPGNRPFRNVFELRYVLGMPISIYGHAAPHLRIGEPVRVNLNTAGKPVLLTLPGFSQEAVAVLLRLRRSGRRLGTLADLAAMLSPSARQAFNASLPELAVRTRLDTKFVIATVEGWVTGSAVRVRVQALFVRVGARAQLVWRRSA